MKNPIPSLETLSDQALRVQVEAQTFLTGAKPRLGLRRRREQGATMVEYGIMVALIAALSIAAITVIGEEIRDAFTEVVTGLGGTIPE